jgi:hypothetical protein
MSFKKLFTIKFERPNFEYCPAEDSFDMDYTERAFNDEVKMPEVNE